MRCARKRATLAASILTVGLLLPGVARAGDWATYLGGNDRSGFVASETAITPGNASSITVQSVASFAHSITGNPVVVGGNVYLGTWDGIARAIGPTGSSLWTRSLGTTTPTCAGATGIVGSAAVGQTPATTIYMPGGDGQMYALNASDGSILWQTRLGPTPDVIVWGSPAAYNGNVYIGLSSSDDCPLVRGGLYELNGVTGAVEHIWYSVPSGCVGASVWSTPTVDTSDGSIYVTTGNHGTCGSPEPYAEAIVKLNASDLSLMDAWKVPSTQLVSDSDYGGGAVLLNATINNVQRSLVGASNKDGWFYALDRTNLAAGPVWEYQLGPGGASPDDGAGPIAPSGWDGTRLYVPGTNGTINGTSCQGTLRAFNPATGVPVWQDCFADGVALDAPVGVPGVVMVGAGPAVYVLDSATGATLFKYTQPEGRRFYGPGAISNGSIYYGNNNGVLYKLTPASAPPPPSKPVNTGPPVVSGTAQEGQTVSVTDGTWVGSPSPTFTYAWQDCDTDGISNCSTIGGEAANQHMVTGQDVGHTLVALVTAHNSAGGTTQASAATAVVSPPPPSSPPVNVTAPVLSGIAQVGQVLSVTTGAWNGSPPPTFTYTWQDCDADGSANCTAIGGATLSTYNVATNDAGRTVRSVVTATNASGTASKASNASQSVVASASNLLQNPSFENSTSGWTGWQSTLAPASDGISGSGAAIVNLKSGFTSYSIFPSTRPVKPTSANQTFSAGGETRAAVAGAKTCLFIREWSSGGSVVSTASKCVTETTAWQPFPVVAYTTQQTGGSLEVYVYQTGALASASFEVDALTLRSGTSPPPPPPTAPDTTIVSGPTGTTTATSATFTFTSTLPNSSFQCALDSSAFSGCISGVTYSALGVGGHSFQVRAIDSGGTMDATPATRTWTIAATSSNLLVNANFEGSVSGWAGYNSTLSLANDGFIGAGAALVALTSGHTSYSIYPSTRPVRPTSAAVKYSAGGYVRANTGGGKICLYIREWSSGGTVVAAPSACVTATTSWQAFPQVSYTSAQSGGSLEIYVYQSPATPGATFETDGLTLVRG